MLLNQPTGSTSCIWADRWDTLLSLLQCLQSILGFDVFNERPTRKMWLFRFRVMQLYAAPACLRLACETHMWSESLLMTIFRDGRNFNQYERLYKPLMWQKSDFVMPVEREKSIERSPGNSVVKSVPVLETDCKMIVNNESIRKMPMVRHRMTCKARFLKKLARLCISVMSLEAHISFYRW